MNVFVITALAALISSLILGITIASLVQWSPLRKTFLLATLLVLVVECCLFMIFVQNTTQTLIMWGKIAVSALSLLFPICVLISLIYGQDNYHESLKRRKLLLLLIFGVGSATALLCWIQDFILVPAEFPNEIFIITDWGKYFLLFSLLVSIIVLSNLENTWRLTSFSTWKWRNIPLLMIALVFLFWIYAISQMQMFSRLTRPQIGGSLFLMTMTNIIFTIYLIRFGYTGFKGKIEREVVYSSAIILIVGIFLLIIGAIGKLVQIAGGSINLFMSVLAALTVFFLLTATLFSQTLKNRIKRFIDRNIYKNQYDYREQWGQFSESTSSVVTQDDLISIIIEKISSIFKVPEIAIFVDDERQNAYKLEKALNLELKGNYEFYKNSHFPDWLYRLAEAVEVKKLIDEKDSIGLIDQEINLFKTLKAEVCVPLITQRKLIGILTLGTKARQAVFTREDFELLETLANQASVAILNTKLNEKLIASRELESFHKWSSFILHDLKNSVSMLSMVVQNAEKNIQNPEFQKDMLHTISNAVNKMKGMMNKISSIPEKLELHREKAQINDLIAEVLAEGAVSRNNNIKFTQSLDELPPLKIDREQIRKVIENLIINAIEALPNGGDINIETRLINFQPNTFANSKTEPGAEIEIRDTGIGMTEDFIQNKLFKPFQTTKKKGLGIGLYQCREIMQAHGGKIRISSEVNKGTSFKLYLPILNGAPTERLEDLN